ncbi:MAG TPA: amino acid adenylation domain-containing protein [Thermoanaerobaculia bacterium]|nr:amino acid adenylation domain-containing protein [Thermoanaerobaculia bacterium]
MWNLYGPTETAIYAAGGEVTAEPLPVAAGRPLGSARLYVLDAAFEAVAAGAVGELYVGGDGLSRGYLAAPGLTAERFLPDRFAAVPERAGGRLYRTGDRARWRRDGSLEILGRADAQVKVRGVRIEPGEIEAALARHPAVQEAAVGMREELPGGRGLVAYVVPRQAGALTPALLRDHLRRSLPEALVPAHFELRAGALPRMASGKIDRRGLGSAPLATLESWSEDAGGTHREPRTPLEELLAGIFAEVLGRARVGADERFFDLGGHSLLATQVISRVREVCGVELPLRQLFEAPTAAGLAAAVVVAQTAGKAAPPPILRLPRGGELPASFAQARLWFLEQLGIGGAAYNLPAGLRLTGSLDPAALAAALAAIVRRHECLRTTFAAVEGRVIQVVAPPSALPLPIVDLSGLPGLEGEASKIAGEAAKVPFDLTRGPLLRTALLALGDGEHVLLLTMHHIVSDGWSMGVFLRELAAFYEGFAENRPPTILELPLQYADFARWQREWLRGDVLAAQLGYWRERLAGAPALLELPADRPRPAVASSRGARAILQVSAERTAALRDLGRQQGATLFMELLAAFQALLARTSGQDDVLVGTPIANRTRAETEGLIGFFVNTLVLRADLSGGPGFGDLLQQVRETTLGAYAHQDLPFEKLVEELRPERALSHSPLFQAMLTLQNAPLPAPRVAGLAMIPFEVAGDGAKFDLTLRFVEAEGGGLTGQLEYARDLFDAPTMARFLGRLEALLAAAVADPRRPLAEIVLLGAGERHQVVHEWNDTAAAFPRDLCLHQLFAAQAARTPASVAVVGAAERLTYGELEARANRLARCLRGLGVGPETRVGIALSRTPDLLVGLLGILKAGGAYVPLDPSYPRERLELILADAQQGTAAPVLVTEQGLLGRLPAFGGRTLCLDRDRAEIAGESASPLAAAEIGVEPSNLAYVIYTSGSTGRPKGVAIAHASAVALIGWASGVYGDAELAGVLASTSITFDLSVFELFLPLARGGKVILAENALALPELAAAAEVTLVNTVPSALAELLRVNGMPASVAVVNLAGEPLRSSLASRLHGLGTVRGMWNLYGPTEDTTYSTCARVAADEGREPTIGRPIAGSRAYVLDREQRPQPVGVPGELCLGGRGLARGYLDRPDLTARSFLPDPCSQTAGERLYRTGDLARFLPDGRLEFVGRLDHQVKLRGFRIELGEIEARLLAHPAVRESVVLAREDAPGEKRLVAYVVARSGDLATTASNLHAHLREALPDYMLPAAFVALDALPRTPNGKVDRKALPPPERERDETGYVAPRGPVEELLAGIWSEVLRAERIGARDSFFDLGGHSLLALQVVSRLRERCGLEVPVRALFEAPTLAGLARWIAAAEVGVRRELPPIARVPRADLLPLSFAQERMWFLHQLDPGSPLFNIAGGVRVQGCLRPPALTAALASLVRRHEALRTVFVAAGGQPRQRIAAAAPEPPLHELDLRGLPAERRDAELELIGEELSRQPFDLAAGPLLRAAIVRVAGPEDAAGAVDALLLSLHHLIADGWSLTVLVRELAAVYEARLRGQTVAFEELSVQPVDHAVWQRRWLRGEVLERELSYWRGELAGEPPGLALQADRPRGAAPGTRAGGRPLDLPPALAASLADLGRREGVTLFMTALAGFAAVLGRQSGLEELWVGSPVAGRGRSEIEGLIGLFANTLVLRVDLADDPPVSRLLARIRASALAAYMHQDLPFDKLVAELRPSRGGGSPLFQAFLAVDPAAVLPVRLAGAPLLPWTPDRGATPFDLSFLLVARGGGLQGTLEYRRELFDAATIDRLAGHLAALLGGAAAGPDRRLSELPWLAPPERHQLLHEWSGATAFFAEGKLLHELFEEQAARRPWAVAVTDGGEALTYGELDARADRLARRLQGLGVAPEVRVGLCLERSPALIVGLLAILKAGGAYVPLDPAYPRERLSFLLADSGAGIVLTEETLLPALPEAAGKRPLRRIAIDTPPAEETVPAAPRRAASSPETLAYVIYTSGSTGHPKGSLISHRNVTRLLAAATPLFGLGAGDVWTLFHSFAFDFSVWEIWGALAAGGRLAIVPHWMSRSPADFAAFLAQERVTVLNQTPAAFRQLAQVVTGGPSGERPELPDLRLVILGGEALEVASLAPWLARFGDERPRLVNMYGITETTVHVTARRLEARDLRQPGRSPIGAPLADLRIYLLDRWGGLAPTGAAGEVHVGGPGLARGYLGRPELTALRFVPDPFAAEPGERLYRTGDLARYRAAGDLEYLGRADDQVKVRGFRIEPGEVEAALASHPAVAEAAVVARRGAAGEPSLVAYVALRRGVTEGTAALRRHLKERLPEPLLPAAYVVLPALPLTAHGKVDRRALPEPAADRPDLGHVALPPRTAPEAELAATWCALLGLSEVGVEDSFFDLGGHSLLFTRLASRLRAQFGVEVPLRVLFDAPTIVQMTVAIAALLLAELDGGEAADLLREVAALSPAAAVSELAAEAAFAGREALLEAAAR